MWRLIDVIRVSLGWSIVLVGLVIIVTALGARTVRQYGEPGDWNATTATDGLRNWQGLVLLAVLLTWVVLIVVLVAERPRWWLLLAPIGGFLWAAVSTDAHRQGLLAEQAGPRTYQTDIPIKPPSGPIVGEDGFPLHFQTAVRVYDLRIPAGVELVADGCLAMAGLALLLMLIWLAEDVVRRRQGRARSSVLAA